MLKKKFSNHPNLGLWVVIQHVSVKGILALKFFLIANQFGPDLIGLIGMAMICIIIGECLSETGLNLAIVQAKRKPTPDQFGAVWMIQAFRGLLISIFLYALAGPLAILFKAPESAQLIIIAALIPLIKNTINPNIFLLQRDRNFKSLFFYEFFGAFCDLIFTITLINFGIGVSSILWGSIVGESIKCLLTWTWYRSPIKLNTQWKSIKHLISFGKWVWGSSVITLILNQLDKIIIARFMGPFELGLYQMASRITQITLADASNAFGQYLFPVFSERFRNSKSESLKYLINILNFLIPLIVTISIIVWFSAPFAISVFFGREWDQVTPILRALIVPMSIGAIISILVPYLRAIGIPRRVTESTLLQLIILLLTAPILSYKFGIFGLIASLTISGLFAAFYMIFIIFKK